MSRLDLSIVIVNWNTKDFLKNAVNSVIETVKDIEYEIFIVDNNSTDGSTELIKNEIKGENIIPIFSETNLGFAGGNNIAIEKSKANAILLLNPDTIVKENVIINTYKELMSNEKYGVCGAKVLNVDGTIQKACRRKIPTPKDAFFKLFGISKLFKNTEYFNRYNVGNKSEDEFLDVDSVSGAFLMIKKEVIDKIGMLDDNFFMYGEEMDLCVRASNEGYLIRYCPVGEIIHYKGESSKQLGFKATYEFYRAMRLFYKKNLSKKYNFLLNILVYAGIYLLMGIALLLNTLGIKKHVGMKG